MLLLEGFQYDVTADMLTARVAQVGQAGTEEAARADLEVPVGYGLRWLIHGTMRLLSRAIGEPHLEIDPGEPSSDHAG